MLRLFVAVDLPNSMRDQIVPICKGITGARWSKPEQLHVTLRFLGAVPEGDLDRIRQALATVRHPAFRLEIRHAGVFPPHKLPRVMWLGLAPAEPLCALKEKIDAVLGPDPESAQRTFSPHLTLARFTSQPRDELTQFLAAYGEFQAGPWPVHEFQLYQSTLRRTGAVHEVIQTYRLE
jgi:2'-5' RNA ligase